METDYEDETPGQYARPARMVIPGDFREERVRDPDYIFRDLYTWWLGFADPAFYYADLNTPARRRVHGCSLEFIKRLYEVGVGSDEFGGMQMGKPWLEVSFTAIRLIFEYEPPKIHPTGPKEVPGLQLIGVYVDPQCAGQKLRYRIRLGSRQPNFTAQMLGAFEERVKSIAKQIVENYPWKQMNDTDPEVGE